MFLQEETKQSIPIIRLHDRYYISPDPRVKSATYQAILRQEDTGYYRTRSKPVIPGEKISEGLIEVDFVLENNKHARELFLHAVPHENLLKREAKRKPGIPLNVLVIGLDSVSHGSAQRKLPLVYKYLRDELGAYFFHGHSVTGDGTVEQMAPMLTGRKFMEELYEARPDRSRPRKVDGWPWIYKQLKGRKIVAKYLKCRDSVIPTQCSNHFRTDHYL